MNNILQDIRYAMRGLRQKPLFALIAILSIAIGVGANATIFSVVNALLLRAPRGIGSPERVVEVGRTSSGHGFDTFSYPELKSIASDVKSFDRVAGTRDVPMSFTGPTGAGERVLGMAVSAPYFDALGTTPQKGRFFTAQEDATPGVNYVVVVSHAFWKKQLQGRADVIGQTIELNRHPFTVVGVTAPDFAGQMPIIRTDLYIPLTMFSAGKPAFDGFASWGSSWLTIVARLAPGATVDRANDELAAYFTRLRAQHPEVYSQDGDRRSARAASLGGVPAAAHGPITAFLSLLMGLVSLVLLTTCANVAGMLIARAAGREREIAIRLALGSGRKRLVGQLVTESLILFVAGGAIGLLLSTWGLRAFASLTLPVPVVLNLDFTPDMRVFTFGLGVALLTGVIFGLVPALQATRPNLVSSLKNEGNASHSRGGRMRRIFVVAQISLSLILLVSAGLFLHSLQRVGTIDTGFSAAGVQMMQLDLSLDGYDDARGREFVRALTTNLAAVPGVSAAAVATDLPLDLGIRGTGTYPEGWQSKNGDAMSASFNQVSPQYFDALSIKVVEGRGFQESDVATSEGVAVVSRSYADKVWPGKSAIGKRIHWNEMNGPMKTVVGVVPDVKNKMVSDGADNMVYVPESQDYDPSFTLVVKTRLKGREAEQMIRRQISALDPNISLTPMQSLEGMTSMGTFPQRIAAMITTALGALALLLSGMGIYGVIAYMVTQRTREIGVRMAIGARNRDVVELVIRSALRLALPGLLIGAAGALAFGRLIRSFLLNVAPTDPVTFSAVPVLLLLMIGVATCMPALRASRVSPMTALRSE